MLQDLEARQHAPVSSVTNRPLYEDLRPVMSEPPRRRTVLYVLYGLAVALAAGMFVLMQWRAHEEAPVAAASTRPSGSTALQQPRPGATTAVSRLPAAPVTPAATRPQQAMVRHTAATRRLGTQAESIRRRADVRPLRPEKGLAAAIIGDSQAHVAQTTAQTSTDETQIDRKEIPLTAAQIAENSYRDGARLLEEGHRAEGEAALESALVSDPRHEKARELLAGLLLEDGRWPEAEKLLKQGVAALPHETAFSYLLARIEVEHGAEPHAIRLLEQGLPDASADPDYLALLATLYQRSGRNTDAIKTFSQALALRPLAGRWWLGLAISFEAQKDWSDAREAYTRAKMSNLDTDLAKYADERLSAIRFK